MAFTPSKDYKRQAREQKKLEKRMARDEAKAEKFEAQRLAEEAAPDADESRSRRDEEQREGKGQHRLEEPAEGQATSGGRALSD